MHFTSSLLVAALAGYVHAQTPNGFTPSVNTKLEVIFNTTSVTTPGQLLTKAETASQPQIALNSAVLNSSATYMFVMVDLDVPPAQGETKRRVLLHAMNTGFKATQQTINGTVTLLASSDQGPAPYFGPGPPATDTIPHRYVQLLFQQPDNLNVSAADFADTSARFNFDVPSFMAQNGISASLGANFITVDGRASASGSGAAKPSGGMTKNRL